jgi:hypothetical protein
MVLYRITPQSGIDHDHVSVVKILLKAFPLTPSCNKRHHTYGYVTFSKVNARSSGTSSDVTIWRLGAQRSYGMVALRHINVKSLHESCRMCRCIVVMNLTCSLAHRERDGHTVQELSQRRLTADWLDLLESDCSQMHSRVSSDWLPGYIKATWMVLKILRVDGYFPDSPHTCSDKEECCQGMAKTRYMRFCI